MKKSFVIFLSLCNLCYADTINLNAVAYSSAGMSTQDSLVSGVHDIEIINDTDSPHYYSYRYSLCLENGRCRTGGENTITVAAHSHWNSHYDNYLHAKLDKGSHMSTVQTTVWGYQYKGKISYAEITIY